MIDINFKHLTFLALLSLSGVACGGGSLDNADGFTGGGPGVGGGSGTGASTGTGGAGTYCDAQPILQTKCGTFTCHGDPGRASLVTTDFNNPPEGVTVGQNLLDRPANYELASNAEACPPAGSEMVINSANAEESVLLRRVLGTQSCGDTMPSETDRLSEADIQCLREWITGVIEAGPAN